MSGQETEYPTWYITTLTGQELTVKGQLRIEYPMVQIVQSELVSDEFGVHRATDTIQFAATLDNVFIVRDEDPVTEQ